MESNEIFLFYLSSKNDDLNIYHLKSRILKNIFISLMTWILENALFQTNMNAYYYMQQHWKSGTVSINSCTILLQNIKFYCKLIIKIINNSISQYSSKASVRAPLFSSVVWSGLGVCVWKYVQCWQVTLMRLLFHSLHCTVFFPPKYWVKVDKAILPRDCFP